MALLLTSLGAISSESVTLYPSIAIGGFTGFMAYTKGGYFWVPFVLWAIPGIMGLTIGWALTPGKPKWHKE